MKLTLRTVMAALLAVVASVCRADETTSVDLPHIEPTQVTYHAYDPQHVLINENTLLSEMARSMSSLTKWPVTSKRDTSDAVLETGSRTQLDGQQHVLVIQYLAHSRYLSGGYTGTTLSIPVAYAIDRGDDTVKITLTYPDHATIERRGMPVLTRKLWDTREILDDYTAIVGSARSMDLHFNYRARGELESKYKPDAVLGNLERLLGRPSRGSTASAQGAGSGEVVREESFICTVNGTRREVQVSTFPYHEGTKVSYGAVLPYTLRPDGSILDGEDLAAINAVLSKVIND